MMVDLSANGCCIQVPGKPPRVNSKIIVRPDGLDGLKANVKWVSNYQCGVVFERPIYGPVLEHFLRKHATFAALVTL